MLTRYLKRFHMQLDFRRISLQRAVLPEGFIWRAWSPRLLRDHAAVKCASFHREMDSHMFAALATYAGCEDLMRGIAKHSGFLPEATWLIEFVGNEIAGPVPCGTIQGISLNTTQGSIQNVGVVADYRGLGLGRALVLKSLAGFRRDGLLRVSLDVTAENTPAVELYKSIGFRSVSTSYRELPYPIEMAR
ncbi:GNAT family N-acetyltransferase [Planctomicrobium sp. SH661]|uniref:GNAT family N-acetyltransferase n=1 Tax=Planctomicrobium sp. SH661 TaxID=3448124 RepID=UPI003F5C0CEC